ncbi:MAG: binding domain protein [Verrucomicrobiales bacterium]|nr:binding domain protein [Verrucomicrobiales bacterium]
MNDSHLLQVARELKIRPQQVLATAKLLAEGATVPFISRYRKEATGLLDEVAVAAIRDRLTQLAELQSRRESIIASLQERSLLTDDLKKSIFEAETLTALEDLYLPFRPKRRTRATIAKEAGLEPLAEMIFAQNEKLDPKAEAAAFINKEKGIETADQALAGSRDIIAEMVNDDRLVREKLREVYQKQSTIRSKVLEEKKEAGIKFKDYYDWSEPVASVPSHRLLAMRRGETEGVLLVRMHPPEESAVGLLESIVVKNASSSGLQVRLAAQDCYKRLLCFALEGELRIDSKRKADEEAIRVFADNIRELLLGSPLGQKNVIAIDPGFRTGCKVVCLDKQGKLLHNTVIYPTTGTGSAVESAAELKALCVKYQIEAIAIGNGTAGRETEAFVRKIGLPASIMVVMVNESGASIYSASDVAREEFPDQDLTVRGAVSIGRRLQDPLAELVKIDPKSIGVGQYQHDVDQSALKKTLDDVVMSCVNGVGVELNSASKQLLTYVSGIGPQIAVNIVNHRNANGPFKSRNELLKVPRLGPKAFEQAAGFLRIRDAENPLDASAVHPESYPLVNAMAHDAGCSVRQLITTDARKKIKLEKYVSDTVGLPTLNDILSELARPGRDPRQVFEAFQFKSGVDKIEDLQPGMKLPGIVTNVTAFGAFVDIGVHQDGLVHISQIADQFVKNPSDVLKVQQKVTVTVVEVDPLRKRIALSMKSNPEIGPARANGPEVRGPRPAARPSTPPPKQSFGGDWFSQAVSKGKK